MSCEAIYELRGHVLSRSARSAQFLRQLLDPFILSHLIVKPRFEPVFA